MKNKELILVVVGIVVVVLAGLLLWHPWGGGPASPPQQAVAPTIPQVPQTPAGYSAKLSSTNLTIIVPGETKPVVISAGEITAVHHDTLAAAVKEIQTASSSPAASSSLPSTSTSQARVAGSVSGSAPTGGQGGQVSVSDYLQELAQTMGFVPLSTSYTVIYGKEKVYFAAKGMPNTSNQGKLSVFSYDQISGLTQIAVLPDAGLESVSDIALSPSEQYLVFFQCNKPATGVGCYRLSYGFVVFDLNAKTVVGSIGAQPTSSPQYLYSFGQWFNDTSFSYHVYQPTTKTGNDIVQLGVNAYVPSGDQTFNISP